MKIKSVTAIGISTPLANPIKMAKEAITHANSLLVRLEDSDGNVGWGEATDAPMMNGEMTEGMMAVVKYITPKLVGLEIEAPQDFYAAARPMIYGNDGAISALDIAIYDAFGKATGKPVYELLGGKNRDRVLALWQLAANDLGKDVATAKEKMAEGFRSFKVKSGISPAATDLERVAAIRDAIGKGPCISADANMAFSFEEAITFAEGAEAAGLDFLEQPIDSNNLNGMADITVVANPVGICADEGIHNLSDVEAHHAAKAATGCGFKSIKLGGLTRMYDGAVLANDYGMHVNIAGKMAETAIASAALVHMAMAVPQVDWDMSATCPYLQKDVAINPPTIVDGHLSADDTPGLGLEIDEDEIERVTVLR